MIEIGINGDGGHTGVSVDGCVSYQQFLEGCSALLELCRNKSPFGDLAFQLLGKVCWSSNRMCSRRPAQEPMLILFSLDASTSQLPRG